LSSYCLQLIRSTQGEVKLKKSAKKAKPKEAPTEAAHAEAKKAKKVAQPEKPKKAEPEKVTKELTFPTEGFVNDYGFLKIRNKILEKVGWPVDKKFDVTIDFVDGALVIRKKSA
jgi:hypothetical protein